jgi:hypothetical protein
MLLEVVVAVALLVLGMAVIGAQLQSAGETTYESDHLSRLVFLAESKFAELDSGLVVPNEEIGGESGVEIEEDFGRLFPQYASRVTLKPTATPDLVFVQLDIFYDPERMIFESGEQLDEFDFDDELIVQTYYTLRAVPKPLNLKTDFGLEDELADRINEDLGSSSIGNSVDVENFSPAVFKDLTLEQLVELLSILQQAFGTDQATLLQLVPESMRGQLQALLAGLGADANDESGDGSEGGEGMQDGAGGGGGRGRGDRTGERPRGRDRRDDAEGARQGDDGTQPPADPTGGSDGTDRDSRRPAGRDGDQRRPGGGSGG